MNNKAQMQGNIGAIVLLIVGVGISVLTLIFMSTMGAQVYSSTQEDIAKIGNNVIVNETFVPRSNVPAYFDHSFIQDGTLIIINGTTNARVNLSNFTLDYDSGNYILKADQTIWNGSTLKASYIWGAKEIRESTQAGIVSSFDAIEKTGKYLPLIVLAIVITIILSLIVGMGIGTNGGGGRSAL